MDPGQRQIACRREEPAARYGADGARALEGIRELLDRNRDQGGFVDQRQQVCAAQRAALAGNRGQQNALED